VSDKIVVPLDGSRLSELALPPTEAIARQFNSEILLVRVCQPTPVPFELYTLGLDVTADYDHAVQHAGPCRVLLVRAQWDQVENSVDAWP
jgi:nucleotide-binding universal stress UspA family protein